MFIVSVLSALDNHPIPNENDNKLNSRPLFACPVWLRLCASSSTSRVSPECVCFDFSTVENVAAVSCSMRLSHGKRGRGRLDVSGRRGLPFHLPFPRKIVRAPLFMT